VIAPLRENLQQRGIAALGLLPQVIVSKYCDQLPLFRQEQIYWNRPHLDYQTAAIDACYGS
jgi:hypothetical protein